MLDDFEPDAEGTEDEAGLRGAAGRWLIFLRARMVNDLRTPDRGWAVLADPEGNEFCVRTRPADEVGLTK